MSLEVFNAVAQKVVSGDVQLVSEPVIEVRRVSDNALVTLYEDSGGVTPLGNPYTAGTDGIIQFYTESDKCNVTATKGTDTITWPDVLIGHDSRFSDYDEGSTETTVSAALDARVPTQNTLAAFQSNVTSSTYSDGQFIDLKGRSSIGDGGGGRFRVHTTDKSAEVAADEVGSGLGDGGVWIAFGDDLTGASGAIERINVEFITTEMYGVAASGDQDTIVLMRNRAATLNVPILESEQVYLLSDSLQNETEEPTLEILGKVGTVYRLSAAPSDDSEFGIQYIERFVGDESIVIENAEWDANDFLPTNDTGVRGLFFRPIPKNLELSNIKVTGNFGSQEQQGAASIAASNIKDAEDTTPHMVKIHRVQLDGEDRTYGTGLQLSGAPESGQDDLGENVLLGTIDGNQFIGFNWGIIVRRNKANWITGNDVEAGRRGIFVFGIEPQVAQADETLLDHPENFPNFVTFNRVRLPDSGSAGQGGIVFGIGAGPNFCIGNSVYSDSTDNILIESDTPVAAVDESFEPRSIILGNVTRGGRVGVQTNDTKLIIANNHISHADDYSIYLKGSATAQSILLDGNLCEDARIRLGNGSGGSAVQHAMVGYNNVVFRSDRSLTMNSETVQNENLNTQKPKLVERFDEDDTPAAIKDEDNVITTYLYNKGVAGDVWEFDTSNANCDAWMPSTQRLQPGQEVACMRWAGTNTITIKPVEGSFDDGDVDTTNNTIDLHHGTSSNGGSGPILNEFRSSADFNVVDGRPIRFSNRNAGTLPSPLTADRIYYAIWDSNVNSTTVRLKVADTEADALAGTAISLTTTGDSTDKYGGDILYDNTRTSVASLTVSEMERFISGRGCWYQL